MSLLIMDSKNSIIVTQVYLTRAQAEELLDANQDLFIYETSNDEKITLYVSDSLSTYKKLESLKFF